MEPKFKPGDRVRVLESEILDADVRGAVATVMGFARGNDRLSRLIGQPFDSDTMVYTLDVDFGVGVRLVVEDWLELA